MLSENETIGSTELAGRIHAIAGEPPALAQRMLRQWVEERALPTAGPVRTGHGNSRSFDDMAALMAGIAASLSRWRTPSMVIRMVVAALLDREAAAGGRLRQILDGKLDAILVLQNGDQKGSVRYFLIDRPAMPEFLASDEFGGDAANAILLDLPKLWKAVAATGFEPKAGAAIQAAVEGRAEAIVAAGRAAARASRDEIETRRLAMEERRLFKRKADIDARAAAARKAKEAAP